MTTHSVHLAETSEISRMNILKTKDKCSIAMQPTNNLNKFGKDHLKLQGLNLVECIERYLDARRNVLLFSKGVILIEGDAEEILIPNISKAALGISLDEIGIGLVNIGSTAFEYIASLFDSSRINRYCAIISDYDKQAVNSTSPLFKADAEKAGIERKVKWDTLYHDNFWVKPFYAEHTFEIEFITETDNYKYVSQVISKIYTQKAAIERNQNAINEYDARNEEMLRLANTLGKGWLATIIAGEIDCNVYIPTYILDAVAFASQETMSLRIYEKMIAYVLGLYSDDKSKSFLKKINEPQYINEFLPESEYEDDIVKKFINTCELYCSLL